MFSNHKTRLKVKITNRKILSIQIDSKIRSEIKNNFCLILTAERSQRYLSREQKNLIKIKFCNNLKILSCLAQMIRNTESWVDMSQTSPVRASIRFLIISSMVADNFRNRNSPKVHAFELGFSIPWLELSFVDRLVIPCWWWNLLNDLGTFTSDVAFRY